MSLGLCDVPFDRALSDREAERPVTLLAAVRDGERILIAADGSRSRSDRASGASGTDVAAKLRQVGDLPMVWGYRGDEDDGEPVALELEDHPPADCQLALSTIADHVRRSNVKMIRGVKDPAADTRDKLEVLAAGLVDGGLTLGHIDWWGNWTPMSDACFVGNGWVSGYAAWDAASKVDSSGDVEQRLRVTMAALVMHVGILGPPLSFRALGSEPPYVTVLRESA